VPSFAQKLSTMLTTLRRPKHRYASFFAAAAHESALRGLIVKGEALSENEADGGRQRIC